MWVLKTEILVIMYDHIKKIEIQQYYADGLKSVEKVNSQTC